MLKTVLLHNIFVERKKERKKNTVLPVFEYFKIYFHIFIHYYFLLLLFAVWATIVVLVELVEFLVTLYFKVSLLHVTLK